LSEIEGVATHVGFVSRGRLKFQESMEGLSARMRQVHVTLEEGAAAPAAFPTEWVGARRVGNVPIRRYAASRTVSSRAFAHSWARLAEST
jgi:hypothetical protein